MGRLIVRLLMQQLVGEGEEPDSAIAPTALIKQASARAARLCAKL
ncbi:hypothetical protein [Streptomyces sp. NPDC048411]